MRFDKLRKFQDELTSGTIPGNDCIIKENNKTIYRYTSGYADVEDKRPVEGNELYFLWSATKPVTTALGLKLYEDGKLSMDTPLAYYLLEYEKMTKKIQVSGKEEIVPVKNKILVKHLFTMTSGMCYDFKTDSILRVGRETHGDYDTVKVARAVADTPLLSEPGECWCYGMSHDVLAAVIELVTGKRLRDHAQEVLFEPLGMEDTSYNLPESGKMGRMATQYSYMPDRKTYVRAHSCNHILGPKYDSGGAGIISTCEDFSKFADMIATGRSENGFSFLKPETIDLWRTNVLSRDQIEKSYVWESTKGYGYGYGVRTLMDPEKAGIPLSPPGEFGWGGAAGTWIVMEPIKKLSLVYFQHILNIDDTYIIRQLTKLMYEGL